ncbi:taste receptor type 2 member 7-like [Heteronotia binoei]|uniref:taste receptor type 2 member 7-like n=1 Tax=Heteronotia binoei TaxID=13085 RepID=UPI002930C270|nr:taste receptor type 2 member 7-like [Heteronotia binoei]
MVPTLWIFMNTTTIWFATCLSICYLAMIAMFSHPVFLQVKQRFSGLVPPLLLGSVVFSAIMALVVVASLSNGFLMYITTVWFATWLSVFYLAKIATFSHPIFLQVKQRFSGLVPRLLLGSVVFSAIMTLVVVASLSNGFSICDSNKSILNVSDSEITPPDLYIHLVFLVAVPNVIPLIILMSSSILLMTSLWMHTRRMQGNGTGIKDLNTQAHRTAIKALASFAVLYLFSFLAATAQAVMLWKHVDDTWLFMMVDIVIVSYPSGHGTILILINPRLKQAVMIWENMDDTWIFVMLSIVTVSCPSGHAIILILINPKLKQAWVRMLLPLKCCSGEVLV